MNYCSQCGGLLDIDGSCENNCKYDEVEDPNHPKIRPDDWPTHCESCGVKFKKNNTYCYNYCPDC